MTQPTNGEQLLPVCISDADMNDLISALDLYSVLGFSGKIYPAFQSVLEAKQYRDNPQDSPCLDCGCDDSTGGACFRMDTTTEIFDFYPNDPFDPSDESATIIGGRWRRFADITGLEETPQWLQLAEEVLGGSYGYFANDCFVWYSDDDFSLFPDANDFWDFINNAGNVIPFPTATIKAQGTGQLEIEFPILPFGGRCIIFKNFEPEWNDILDIVNGNFDNVSLFTTVVELERDLISSTPEFIPTTIVEIELEEDQLHTIRCVFVPTVEPDQAPFIFPFGAIREIEFCGNLQVVGSQTGNTYNKSTYRNQEAMRRNIIMSTVQDICEGMICAFEKLSQRILLANESDNIRNSVEIDKDTGQTIVKTSSGLSGVKIPENATSDEILYGQALAVGRGFRDVVGELVVWRGNAITIESIVSRLRQLYRFLHPVEGAVTDALLDSLNSTLDNAIDQTTPTVNISQIASYVYCNGANKQSLYRYALDVEESGTTDAVHISAFYRSLIDGIEQSQIDAWYESGAASPSGGYESTECFRLDTQEVEYTSDDFQTQNPARFYLTTLQNNRRKRLEISGKIVDSEGREFDGVYFKLANGTISYASPVVLRRNGSTTNITPVTTPQYKPNGGYSIEYQVTGNSSISEAYIITGPADNPNRDAFVNPTGILTVKLYDMGVI